MELMTTDKDTKPKSTEPKKAVYDPNKHYTWKPDASFTMNGEAFMAMLNTVRSILATKEAATVLWADKANDHIEELFKIAVESGIATETNAKK